jgi:amino acid transporter
MYVSALAIGYAGRLAPVCLLHSAGTLFLFRFVYAEVVGALPLNGGAYNALLNTTSKYRASIAACLTILSYMATAVISANEAMHYLHSLWHGLPVIWATGGLLGFFMILSIIGITESAVVAVGIFLFHMTSMTLLLVFGVWTIFMVGPALLWENMGTPAPGGFWLAWVISIDAVLVLSGATLTSFVGVTGLW